MTISDPIKEAFGRLVQPERFPDMHEVVLLECTDAITGLPVHAVCAILKRGDAVLVKLADLRHNSDIRRLKGVTEKDIKRMIKYHELHMELNEFRRNYQGAPA